MSDSEHKPRFGADDFKFIAQRMKEVRAEDIPILCGLCGAERYTDWISRSVLVSTTCSACNSSTGRRALASGNF